MHCLSTDATPNRRLGLSPMTLLPHALAKQGLRRGQVLCLSWDARLVPPRINLQQPLDYRSTSGAAASAARVDHAALVKYFAEHDPSVLGRLDS